MKNTIRSKWPEILEFLKNEYNISDVSYKTWLLPLQIHDIKDDTIIISVDSDIISKESLLFVIKKYAQLIKTSIEEVTNLDYNIEIYNTDQLKGVDSTKKSAQKDGKSTDYASFLNPRYTFDTFVVGPNNKFAHAAALAVAEEPGSIYNPLFIYGGVGLGKTHLMHSIAHYIMQNNPSYKVLYVSSEFFTNEVIQSIRYGKTNPEDLRAKYRNLDVLLIDDIQFVIGKESTQEEFFHTFNTLYGMDKQIIISSDKPPKDIVTLEDRLRSRFECGLTVDIQAPDYETRMAILNRKKESDNLNISDEVLHYIADNVKSNIRELEGSLTKIVAVSRFQRRDIDLPLAEEALKDIISPNNKKMVTLSSIVDIVADHFNITSQEIYSNSRSRNVVYPRHLVMYLCKRLTSLSQTEIGSLLGNRDHSTVIHGINKIDSSMADDETLANTVDVLIKKINPQ